MSEVTRPIAAEPVSLSVVEGGGAEVQPISRARATLLKRLADVVCLPSSRVNTFERAMTADLLVDMLREASVDERAKVARRLACLTEIPAILARLLLRDKFEVSRHLIEECASIPDGDLIDCIKNATVEHRRLIAARRGVNELVSEALIEVGEPIVVEVLLRNDQAILSAPAIETATALTRENPKLIGLLLKRPELRPSQAYAMFWWADQDARRIILQRFAVSREILQDAASDVFAIAADERWQDHLSRKALQFIERRQRNRAALEKSRFESLEQAVSEAEAGMTRETAEEISYLSGLKPMTGAKIFTDAGGEPLAMLCKATGLPRTAVVQLWKALRRPEHDSSGAMTTGLQHAIEIYDMVAVDRAQTVLRYWNWSLSSAMTPALMRAIRDGDEQALDEYSVPQRVALLALSGDFGRSA
jgi:uncharacterized protein (DUF2336 family)